MPLYHSILTGIAMGNGQVSSSLKRANIQRDVGEKAIHELCDMGIIKKDAKGILYFSTPFLRFWFAFISPLFQGIKKGDYKEIKQRFSNRYGEFIQFTFIQLSQEYLKLSLQDDKIIQCYSYIDKDTQIDIYAKTKSGKIIVGSCKYIDSKMKKSELTRLQEKCKTLNINADIFVLFSKVGFSSQLKKLKSDTLKLYTPKNLRSFYEKTRSK